ncbi:transposase [Silvibacterium bohemicum]|uniref:transposase n=1 Tax=Silvibacterium bohemicum TaxID=1577686 RepID=UPI001E3B6D1A|nr:transposase [Silvibacterium bohemicum]
MPQETRTYFVTAVTAQRRRLFQVETNARLFEETILDYRKQGKFLLHAFIIMPDHFHALLTPVPEISSKRQCNLSKADFLSGSKAS